MQFISRIIDFFAAAFVSEHTHLDTLVEIEMNEAQLSRSALRGGPHCTILYICPTMALARIRAHQMGYPYKVHFIAAGGALLGAGFDEVIVDQDCNRVLADKGWSQRKIEDWIACAVVCRLFPGGRMRYLQ